ncbi:MAG: D-alanyl-D-alanine carboxypeptidase family protein, partial [Bacilli bacterium]|nr:D-alanyl-D-alanine carboxypeptidase family protein [Bacilli bacterium]
MVNQRNYQLARWISGGTFYLVSTKHQAGDPFPANATIDAFVKTGNAAQSLLSLAKTAWNWGDIEENCNFESGVADVKANLRIKSGVRNISDQTVIFNNYVKERGMEEALTFSAKPRHSEHHTGLAMD